MLNQGSDRNSFVDNDYGSIGARGTAGMVVQSSSNTFVNEDFWGTYFGKAAQPCLLLTPSSTANTVSALKYQGAPQGFDVCNQVLDQGSNWAAVASAANRLLNSGGAELNKSSRAIGLGWVPRPRQESTDEVPSLRAQVKGRCVEVRCRVRKDEGAYHLC
jgi:hypothetical protein